MQIFANKKFENPVRILYAFDKESFIEAFSQIENLRKRQNHYLLGYIHYEAKDIFLGKKIKSKYPLLYFEVYCHCEEGQSPDAAIQENNFGLLHSVRNDLIPLVNYKTYSKAIAQIKEEIANGNTYEINYTYDYKIKTDIDGFELYKNILPQQTTPYNAYIKNEYEEILSFSPELFFELENNKIRTKPMKGTIKRGKNEEEDKANIEFLKNNIKNRAENVMIVDLLRNDLGKIAKTGTVKVDKLFDIETHPTVHQMTSEIIAELEEKTTLFEIFEAIFPCGSITGAPKISTMEIIDKIEVGKREVYCGAIGLISPEKTVFSVPIRILQKKAKENFFLCRVGGAIVWDSTPKEEWEETLTKISFLNKALCHCEEEVNVLPQAKECSCHCEEGHNSDTAIQENNFELTYSVRNDVMVGRAYLPDNIKLVETILIKNGEIKYKNKHFARMEKSAKELGFKFPQSFHSSPFALHENKEKDLILRILLNKEGCFETQYLTLDKIKTNKVIISNNKIDSKKNLLLHKTTFRPWYEDSMNKIKNNKIFDEIFFNKKGELTEGARSNIILQIDGQLFTPPVECGLLNGIMRQELIKQKKIKEKNLYLKELKKAEKVFCINSVRGIVEVEIDW